MRHIAYYMRLMIVLLVMACVVPMVPATAAVPTWTSPNHYRLILTVSSNGITRKNSPASADVDFIQALINKGSTGKFDDSTIEVIAYNTLGQPMIFDSTRSGYEKYLLPWRIQKYYGLNKVTLSFVISSSSYTQFVVYFDTKESRMGKPDRYPGMVGDGDQFSDGYRRREINAGTNDCFADIDNDGDLDILKGGVEPYVFVYENVGGHKSPQEGGNRYVERGKLTSGGQVLKFPTDGNNRSWLSVQGYDWDHDGDCDLFVHIAAPIEWYGAPYRIPSNWQPGLSSIQEVLCYENTTIPGGQLTFTFRGPLRTTTGKDMVTPISSFVDWNNDGKMDILGSRDGAVVYYENISTNNQVSNINVKDGVCIEANGAPIFIQGARADCADLDNDGDLDMIVGTCDGRIYYFENVGTRLNPKFIIGRPIAFYDFMDVQCTVKIADFDGDGLLDYVVGRAWERTQWGEQARFYGCLYKNVGTRTAPRFEARDASAGSPYTEKFQICDAVRQNGVRSVDWNNDGRIDLIASDTDGFVWFFENTTNQLFPVFKPGVKLQADGKPIRVYGEEDYNRAAGYARVEICYWNEDSTDPNKKKDLLVADGRGWLMLYLNVGTDTNPVLAAGTRVYANGHPIDGTSRASVLVCDWDNDGKKDVIFAMVGDNQFSQYADWPHSLGITNARGGGYLSYDKGFLFYKNVGTNTSPVLAYPEWITTTSGAIINYSSRPNLGSYVDWDGDGKKDFITGEFEGSARFYKNLNPSTPGTKPAFAAEPEDKTNGVTIVQPDTMQLMSGADAIDWNKDGTLDIVTGQGHGASGLRFYARDYINDFVRKSNYPIVTVATSAEAGYGPSGAKLKADGTTSVTIPGAIVTATYTGYYYIESENRESGIKVVKTNHGQVVGNRLDVTGTITTDANGERNITSPIAIANGTGTVAPIAMSGKMLGGGDYSYNPTTKAGQRGVDGGNGLNNIGLLTKIFGKCTLNKSANGYLFIDDGSGVVSYYLDGGIYKQANGIKVEVTDATIAINSYLMAQGISSIELVNGVYQRRILLKTGGITKY